MSLKNPSDFFESENNTPGNVEEDVNDSAENNKSSLKKPSDFFGDNSVLLDDVEENIEEDLRDEIPDYEQLNPEQLDYFVAKIDFLSEQLSKKVDKTDLENSMVSQLETLEENITKLKSSYEGIGKIKNDLLREEFSNKLNSISESIDTNIELLNKKFEKSSLQLKRDIATYNSITKIVENKVEKLNDAETNVDNKIEEITTSVNDFISDLERQVDNKLKGAIKSYVTELKNKIDDVRYDIDNLQEFSFRSDISRLEKKIDYIRETYEKIDPESTARQVIEQALLDKTINSDPLSKDDFVTLPQLQEHYRLFLNRIQQQLSTFGGGGIEDAPKYDNGVFIRQGQRWKKFNEVGVQTFTGIHVDPNGIGTTAYPDASFVTVGDARVTGTLSIGTSSIVLDPEAASIGGISEVNATSITAETANFSGNVTIGGTLTYEDVTNVDSIGFVTARENVFVGQDVFVVGVITATTFIGNGDFVNIDVDGHSELDNLNVSGVSTFTGNIDANGNLDVDGHSELDNLNVSGVSTFTGNIDANGNLDVDGHSELDDVNISGVATATAFHTGAEGSAIRINSNTISGPAEIVIDPAAVGDDTGALRIKGDLFVDGTQTVINSTTVELADFIVGIATTATSDSLADGAGIQIGPNNTLLYDHANTSLKSSENLNLISGKTYKIDGTDVLSATTLGSAVVNSSLTSLGTIATGVWQGTAINDTYIDTIDNANKVSLSALNIDGGIDIGALLADGDLIIVDDGAGGTNRKADVLGITSYTFSKVSGDVLINSSGVATIQANSVALATDTTGDFVKSISGTDNEVTVSVTSGENVQPQIGLPDDVTVSNSLKVGTGITAHGGIITATTFDGNATTATNLNNQAASYYLDYNNFVGVATDADKLDGQQGTYYLDYNNFTNTPTIPTNNNELTNGAGYITTSFTNTNQLTNGAGFITSSDTVALAEGLTGTPNLNVGVVTATSFDGDLIGTATTATNLNNQAASYYLDYNNFTNTPTISTFSGDYNDLTNTPTIPSDTGDLTNNVGFITSGGSAQNLTSLTGVSQGVYGNSSNTPQITVDSTGRITSIALVGISGGGGGGGGGLSGINFFNGQTSLGVSTHLSFGNNVTATSIGNTITVNVTGVVTSLSGYATEEYVNTSVASGISSVGIQSGGTSVGTAKTVNFGSSLTATVSGEVATVNVSIPLSALTDVNTSNLTGITTDYLMVYDPTIPGFKFVNPKTYFGINNDANPAADIVDYGDFG